MSPVETLEKQYLRYRKTKAPKDLASVFVGLAPQLMSAARRAGLDQQGAEDAVQETFLAFIAGEERFEAGRPVIPWVRGIAVRQINAERRRQARLKAIFSWDDATPDPSGGTDDPEASKLERVELRRKIDRAIQTLSEGNQDVVKAALFEGLTIEEIASRLKLSRTATSVRLHRGLQRVRKKLGERSSLGLLALTIPKTGKALPATGVAGVPVSSIAMMAAAVLAVVGGAAWLSQSPDRSSEVSDSGIEAELAQVQSNDSALSMGDDALPGSGSRVALGVEEAADALAAPSDSKAVTGTVLTHRGMPAEAGAEVFVLRTNPEIVLPTTPLEPLALTVAGGGFSLDLSALGKDRTPLLVVRLGREIGWLDVSEAELESGELRQIRLEPELEVTAIVKDELGRPIEGADVAGFTDVARFIAPMGPVTDEFGFPSVSGYRHLFGAISDDQGAARIGGLFGAQSPGLLVCLTAKKPGYARGMLAYILDGDEGLEAEFTLPSVESLRMEGSVVDSLGDPVAGVELRFRVRGEAPLSNAVVATTDALGRWTVPNHLLDEFPLFLAFDREGFVREEIVVIEPTELESDPYLVRMQSAGNLGGIVRNEDGEPIEGAEVTVATIRSIKRMVTGADGAFECQVPLDADRSVTVINVQEGQPMQSVRYAASRTSSRVMADIPAHDGVSKQFVAELSAGLRWNEASLVPSEVTGTIALLRPSRLEGSLAYFDDVPHGEWTLCGLTEAGGPVVETLAIGGVTEDRATSVKVTPKTTQTGFLECVVDTDGLWESLSGGQRDCMVVARHLDYPLALPSSTFETGVLSRNELYYETTIGGPMGLEKLLPGNWQISATGPGWATLSAPVLVKPGVRTRLDLEPCAAGTLDLELPTVSRSCMLRFSIRRSVEDPWSVLAIPSVAIGAPDVLTVKIPEGRWLWKTELEADNVGEDFSDLSPPTFGSVTVEAGSSQAVRVLEGRLESSE